MRGNCIIDGCSRPLKENNFCNRHNMKHYWFLHPRRRFMRVLKHEIAEITGLPPWKAKKVIHAIFQTIKSALLRKEAVKIQGFGVFDPAKYHSCRIIHFSPSKELRWMINQDYKGES